VAVQGTQTEAEAGKTDIVLIVPGMDTSRLGHTLEILVDRLDLHLRARADAAAVVVVSRQGEGVGQAVVHVRLKDGTDRRIELRELAWSDVRPTVGDASVYARLVRGTILIRYWIGSWMLKRMPSTSASMRRWTILNCLLLGLWYAMALAAAGHLLLTQIVDLFSLGETLGTPWWVKGLWLAILAALGSEVMSHGLNMSWGIYSFLADKDSFRRKTRARLLGMLTRIAGEGAPAGRIVVLAHSMGTAIAVDALEAAESVAVNRPPIDLITLGSPLEFMALREPALLGAVEKCIRSPMVCTWTDFFDEADAYCSRVPVPTEAGRKFIAHPIDLERTLGEALGMLDRHNAYLKLPEVLDQVAGMVSSATGHIGNTLDRLRW
jgi:hypothetical protein